MVNPTFSLWGYLVGDHVDGEWASCDVPNRVPDQLAPLLSIPVEHARPFVTEGGDKSFNGRGTVLMSKAVEQQRHPNRTIAEIEGLARTYLRVRHIVWTDEGVADDEQSFRGPQQASGGRSVYTTIGTGGHVDECARFVDPTTVILPQLTAEQAKSSPMAALTASRLDANAASLSRAVDQDGHPLSVVRMPFPDEIVMRVNRSDGVYQQLLQLPELHLSSAGEIDVVLAASYTNYVIANGIVLVPQYHRPGRPARVAELDAQAVATMRRLLPGRKVVGINPEPVNAGGGGLNCISNNMPAA